MSDFACDPLLFGATPDHDAAKVKNLWQKLSDVILVVGYIQKRGKYDTKYGGKFSYLQSIDIRREVREELAKRNIILKPSCPKSEQREIVTEKNGDKTVSLHTQLTLKYTLINGDDPVEREECDWVSWAEGKKAFNAYGAYTSGQRHFLDSLLLLLSGEKDAEQYDEEMETAERQVKAEDDARNAERLMMEGSRKVSGKGYAPTFDDLQPAYPENDKNVPEEPLDESWRDFPLTMADKLCKLYKGKGTVGTIELKHLIQANDVFVKNVRSKIPGYDAVGHHQLANHFLGRIIWEEAHGTIKRVISADKTITYDIVPPKS